MRKIHNKELVDYAKNLRKNMTKEEKHLWYDFLKDYPVRFIRQKIIGKYITDFYCAKAKVVIEIDGSQHYDLNGYTEYDKKREKFIEEYGIKIIRVLNGDIHKNFGKVCEDIDSIVMERIKEKI